MPNFSRRDWLKKSLSLASTVATAQWISRNPIDGFPFSFEEENSSAIRLNSNENPHGPSKKALEAISESMKKGNFYPWSVKEEFREKISQMEGFGKDQIYIGAGSTEILQLAGYAYGANGGTVISGYPTFPTLMRHASLFAAKWIKVPVGKSLQYPVDQMALSVDSDVKLVYVCNPNNPTGTYIPSAQLRSVCLEMAKTTMVFIDEAYIEFSEEGLAGTLAGLVNETPNIIVARTFSKIYGMAGLRIGYAYANPETIKQLQKFRVGYGMNVPITSLYAAMAALDDQDFVHFCREQNTLAKEVVYDHFKAWDVEYAPSHTSFIYFKHDRFKGDLRKELQNKGVLIRTYADQPGYSRVSIGTVPQMERFIDASKTCLG
jgi:histidinol-phosphate aminotransferase